METCSNCHNAPEICNCLDKPGEPPERASHVNGSPQFISGWTELAQVPESETHFLQIDTRWGNGWIKEKGNPEAFGHYLSTHTFYGMNHRHSTDVLRRCGFNVTCANWDAPQSTPTNPKP